MYHFIRRFFIFVLVLAFGFSFLLCCFVHTGLCQSATYEPDISALYDVTFTEYYAPRRLNTLSSRLPALPGINQFQQGGRIQSNVPMYSQPFGQFLFSGSTISNMDRMGWPLGTSIQQIHNVEVRPSITGGGTGAFGFGMPWGLGDDLSTKVNLTGIGAFGFGIPAGRSYLLPSSSLSILTSEPGKSYSIFPASLGEPTKFGYFGARNDMSYGMGGCPGFMYCPY
jgi:hypothetical protein